MPKLHIVDGLPEPRVFDLTAPCVTVGRTPDNIIQLKDRSISKHHAALILEDDEYKLFDLHATNGTYVNGQRITVQSLNHNDQIHMGIFVFTYESEIFAATGPISKPATSTVRPLPTLAVSPPKPMPVPVAVQPTPPPPPPTTPAETEEPGVKRSFVRLPGAEVPSQKKSDAIKKLFRREPAPVAPVAAPPPPPPPEPEPVETPITEPAAAQPDAPVASSPAADRSGHQLVTGPRQPRDRILGRPSGAGSGDRALKKPAQK